LFAEPLPVASIHYDDLVLGFRSAMHCEQSWIKRVFKSKNRERLLGRIWKSYFAMSKTILLPENKLSD